jgi:hypothetical protein
VADGEETEALTCRVCYGRSFDPRDVPIEAIGER